MALTTMKAPCSRCLQKTSHHIINFIDQSDPDEGNSKYYFLQCAGCDEVSMAHTYDYGGGEPYADFFPSPVNRKLPDWSWKLQILLGDEVGKLGNLLLEIYAAVRGQHYRLAVMGIRAFFEQLMIVRNGKDEMTFKKNLDAFYNRGDISVVQRNAISHILDSGHATMHRMHMPEEKDLQIALDILESVTAAIYFHEDDAKRVASKVPPRSK